MTSPIELNPLIDLALLNGQNVYEEREWGTYRIIELQKTFSPKYGSYRTHVQKYLTVSPQKRLSLQNHKHRSEHWTIVGGSAIITLGVDPSNLVETKHGVGDYIVIPKGMLHRLANPDKTEMLVIIENAEGEYFEDDITRYQDDFGRA